MTPTDSRHPSPEETPNGEEANPTFASSTRLLLVLLTCGILVICSVWFGFWNLHGGFPLSKTSIARSQVRWLASQVFQFQEEQNRLPESLEDLLVPGGPLNLPYLLDLRALIDPWGSPYHYDRTDPNHVVIWCRSPSGKLISSE
jgi:hypothetical protein